MKRREFVLRASAGMAALSPALSWSPRWSAPWLLVPMDDAQTDHLKAYGLTYRALKRGIRGGMVPELPERGLPPAGRRCYSRRDAALAGVMVEPIDDAALVRIRGELQGGNMDAVPLEKPPKVAVYAPPNAPPWDDAVTMALNYAGIEFEKVWDAEVLGQKLNTYDWLHLHHEDFTGQYSKFFLNYAGLALAGGYGRAQPRHGPASSASPQSPPKSAPSPWPSRASSRRGGFLFAMCTATETLDLALASDGVDIAASYADGTPMDPNARARMKWDRASRLSQRAAGAEPHHVGLFRHRWTPGQFARPAAAARARSRLFNFSAKIDPVATMLVQNHRQVIPDFYGLTTSFTRKTLKPSVTVLAEEPGAPWVKYIHGEQGQGTWTFFGGHDPEDPQHQIGDAPTDLSLHPHSPGYRLILNNVLFPAAKKKELKT